MKSNEWVNDARFISWKFDFSDLGWPDPDLTEKWTRRAEFFQKQGVNSVVLVGFHFRWDYFSILDRIHGILREVTKICHDFNLKVVDYHLPTLVHRIQSEKDRRAIRAPDNSLVPFYPDDWSSFSFEGKKMTKWRQISARDGNPVFSETDFCETFCPNHPQFQKAYRTLIATPLAQIPVDGVIAGRVRFLPDFYSCACNYCQKRFFTETSFEFPPASEADFWENRENPAFLAWIAARYRWNAEHYQRLRKYMPTDVLLCGWASRCLSAELAQSGFSPQLFAEHFDAIFHEINSCYQPTSHLEEIHFEIGGFSALARHYRKPLIALCYVNFPDDLPNWFHLLEEHDARPWIAKQVGQKDAISEESLLENGFNYPKTPEEKPVIEPIQAIVFSETFRDSLESDEANNYVDQCRELSADLVARGSRPFLLFDTMWDSATPVLWECLWLVDSRALDKEKEEKIREWQRQGLAIGIS